MQIADHLRHLEERLLDPAIRKSPALVSTLLADDFLEFGSSGRTFDKAAILEDLLHEPTRPSPLLTDFAVRSLAKDIVLVTYRTTRHSPLRRAHASANRSSGWVQRDDAGRSPSIREYRYRNERIQNLPRNPRKFACQAPKPPNQLKTNQIAAAY